MRLNPAFLQVQDVTPFPRPGEAADETGCSSCIDESSFFRVPNWYHFREYTIMQADFSLGGRFCMKSRSMHEIQVRWSN